MDKLNKYIAEEWNFIQKSLIENICKNYINRIKKVIELDGARLETEKLKKLGEVKKEVFIWLSNFNNFLKFLAITLSILYNFYYWSITENIENNFWIEILKIIIK